MRSLPSKVESQFSSWWYRNANKTCLTLRWMGVGIIKCPLDLMVYQEILWQTEPELVIETGAFVGGSALYLAHVFDAMHGMNGHEGQVLSIDIADQGGELPEHDRIEFLIGKSSTDSEVVEYARRNAEGRRTMVILDSEHSAPHVLEEIKNYAPLVSRGCYLIVEDTNPDGYYLGGGYPDGGPREAVKQWQPNNNGFRVDPDCERLGLTQNPGGYLCRVR